MVNLRDYDRHGVGTPASIDPQNGERSLRDPKFNPPEALGLAEAVESYLGRLVVPQGRFAGAAFPRPSLAVSLRCGRFQSLVSWTRPYPWGAGTVRLPYALAYWPQRWTWTGR